MVQRSRLTRLGLDALRMNRQLTISLLLVALVASVPVAFGQSAGTLILTTNVALNREVSRIVATLGTSVTSAAAARTEIEAVMVRWKDRDAFSRAVLLGNLSHYVVMRYDFGFARESLSTELAWTGLEDAAQIPPTEETLLLGLVQSTAYPRRFGIAARSPDDCRTEITTRWLDCLGRLEAKAAEADSSQLSVPADAEIQVVREQGTSGIDPALIRDPKLRAVQERLKSDSDLSDQLARAAHTARVLRDTASGNAAHFLDGVHNYTGVPERITEVVRLSETSIMDTKLRGKVLDRLQSKLSENIRAHLQSARQAREQELASEQAHSVAEQARQVLSKSLAPRSAAGARVNKSGVSSGVAANRVAGHGGESASARVATSASDTHSSFLWLLFIGAAGLLLFVLWRAQARGNPGRGK